MFVINNRKIFFGISGLLVVVSLMVIFNFGFNVGIDFTGGTLLEVQYSDRPMQEEVETALENLDLGQFVLQPIGESGFILKSRALSEDEHGKVLEALGGEEERFTSIGPTVGNELRRKAYVAIAIVATLIVLFVAWVFRSKGENKKGPVSSWAYGFVAVIALLHDIIIPVGIFTILGHAFGGFEINALFITALLAILGYSVNDTIVVFDRVRENLALNKNQGKFEETVGKSLKQTIARSINTSLTTLLVLLALYFLGGEATQEFTLVLIFGVISGTYSSIFLASPLLVSFAERNKKARG